MGLILVSAPVSRTTFANNFSSSGLHWLWRVSASLYRAFPAICHSQFTHTCLEIPRSIKKRSAFRLLIINNSCSVNSWVPIRFQTEPQFLSSRFPSPRARPLMTMFLKSVAMRLLNTTLTKSTSPLQWLLNAMGRCDEGPRNRYRQSSWFYFSQR